MTTLFIFITITQVISAFFIIGLVLLQHGKGADMGVTFGSSVSGSLFGATGSSNFLSKTTGIVAIIFFATTLTLAFYGKYSRNYNAKIVNSSLGSISHSTIINSNLVLPSSH